MDYKSTFYVALVLLVAGVGLMVWHIRTWRTFQGVEIDPSEKDFRRHQFRRRMQTSAMLMILGQGIFIGQVLTAWLQSQLFLVLFWSGILLLVLWMALLAVADIIATQQYLSRIRTDFVVHRAKLQAELQKMRSKEGTSDEGPCP